MSRIWIQQSLTEGLWQQRGREKTLIRWVVDLRRHCFKIREIAKYLKAEHIESIERTP